VKCDFIFDFDTDAALKRIEKKQKMRRTGQNPRRTGQRSENGGENESGFFRQEDPPTKKQLRRDEAESERSGERLLQAARRVSAANQFAGYTGGLGEWIGYEYGLRRLGGSASSPDPFFNHGCVKSLSDTTLRKLTTERLKKVWTEFTELTEL
jgi:hypothetical protein